MEKLLDMKGDKKMSHTTTIDVKLKDVNIIKKVCKKLNLPIEENAKVTFFDGKMEVGTKVQLPGWRYPICIKRSGEVLFDDYNGVWGDKKELNLLKQHYAVEKTKLVAIKNGYTFQEKQVGNEIKLIVNM